MKTSTLKPGLLISLRTTVAGNVSYDKTDIEQEYRAADGTLRATWETRKTVELPDEHEEATKVRGRCRTLIVALCSKSEFGLLCPEDSRDKLDAAIAEARALADDFNRRASLSRINVYVIAGRIARDDEEAARAVRAEMRDVIEDMERGIRMCDVDAVRAAAKKAKDMQKMLSQDASDRVQEVIKTARSFARKVVKSVEEAQDQIEEVAREVAQTRTAFIDLSDEAEIEAPEVEAHAIMLTPEEMADMAEATETILADTAAGWNDPPALDIAEDDDDGDDPIPARTPQQIELD